MAEPVSVEPARFRRSIARWATGVAVVTARDGESIAGLTVNALLSVSLEPPTLLVSLTTNADTTPVVERSRRFAVCLLGAAQRPLSERFALAVPGPEKFRDVPTHASPAGLPLLDGAIAAFECVLERVVEAGDHHLLLGRVVAVEDGEDALPLTFFRSRYGEALGPDTVRYPPTRA